MTPEARGMRQALADQRIAAAQGRLAALTGIEPQPFDARNADKQIEVMLRSEQVAKFLEDLAVRLEAAPVADLKGKAKK